MPAHVVNVCTFYLEHICSNGYTCTCILVLHVHVVNVCTFYLEHICSNGYTYTYMCMYMYVHFSTTCTAHIRYKVHTCMYKACVIYTRMHEGDKHTCTLRQIHVYTCLYKEIKKTNAFCLIHVHVPCI